MGFGIYFPGDAGGEHACLDVFCRVISSLFGLIENGVSIVLSPDCAGLIRV